MPNELVTERHGTSHFIAGSLEIGHAAPLPDLNRNPNPKPHAVASTARSDYDELMPNRTSESDLDGPRDWRDFTPTPRKWLDFAPTTRNWRDLTPTPRDWTRRRIAIPGRHS